MWLGRPPALNLLAMEIAGLRGAKLYPGSWSEWCADRRGRWREGLRGRHGRQRMKNKGAADR